MLKVQTVNRLIHETSPYLLHHAHNPVDWFPWADEAFYKAKKEGKPILLSVGYSACHWCHVMERESFEDEDTAQVINDHFIPVKVDREERPDIDQIYQSAVQAMGVHGGWPLTVFLTPEGKPFYGGTYYPPKQMYGRPSFLQVLSAINDSWTKKREDLISHGERLTKALKSESIRTKINMNHPPSLEVVSAAITTMIRGIDRKYGGFGHAPKFPNTSDLMLMLLDTRSQTQFDSKKLALFTLKQMALGGIYDQLGGGFHRYSTDEQWLVPHFEKMLYDNAQLLEAYTVAFQITKDSFYENIVRETAEYVLREMISPDGGFFSTQDADSEGVEGRYFLWSYDEVQKLLSEGLFLLIKDYYQLNKQGNFEGQNILHRQESLQTLSKRLGQPICELTSKLDQAKNILLSAREERAKPFRDEKVILGWNGLIISGLARASQVLSESSYLNRAENAAKFVLAKMRQDFSHLLRIYKDDQPKIPAFLEDYAYFVRGLIDLYESTFEPNWLSEALTFTNTVSSEFQLDDNRLSQTSRHGETLITVPISGFDQAIPSGASIHCQNLLRLHALTGREALHDEAGKILTAYAEEISTMGYASFLQALRMFYQPPIEFTVIGFDQDKDQLLSQIRQTFFPYRILVGRRMDEVKVEERLDADLLIDKPAIEGKTTVYACQDFSCHPPVNDTRSLTSLLTELS
jgi:uncharacterized protein YyaL (SSP411 family)